jgi:hypothetical protein
MGVRGARQVSQLGFKKVELAGISGVVVPEGASELGVCRALREGVALGRPVGFEGVVGREPVVFDQPPASEAPN